METPACLQTNKSENRRTGVKFSDPRATGRVRALEAAALHNLPEEEDPFLPLTKRMVVVEGV